MVSDARLRRILVVISVVAYAVAGMADVLLAFSAAVDTKHALGAACVMALGIGLTLYFGRHSEFMSGPLFKGQSVLIGFAAGVWISLVLAVAAGLYPIFGAGRFISFMGYVGSIAFIPPILASAVIAIFDRIRGASRK